MKSRNRQRQERRIKAGRETREEKLDLYDYCGIKDPTPYQAVKNMIRKQEPGVK